MDKVVDEIEESLRKVLDKKIRNAREDFGDRLEAEKRRAEADGMRMVDDEAKDLKAHHKKRMEKIRDAAEQDIERLRDRVAVAEKERQEKKGQLDICKKRLEKVREKAIEREQF